MRTRSILSIPEKPLNRISATLILILHPSTLGVYFIPPHILSLLLLWHISKTPLSPNSPHLSMRYNQAMWWISNTVHVPPRSLLIAGLSIIRVSLPWLCENLCVFIYKLMKTFKIHNLPFSTFFLYFPSLIHHWLYFEIKSCYKH